MAQDEIIEITRQAGGFSPTPEFLETFAKLVAAKEREACFDAAMKAAEAGIDTAIALEREACAKLVEDPFFGAQGKECADAIRARGEPASRGEA